MQNVGLALDIKPHNCINRHNVGHNDLETLVDATVFSITVLGHPGPGQPVTSCEPPAVVNRAYHLLKDIMVKLTSDDHLDNLIKVLLVSTQVSNNFFWKFSQLTAKVQDFKVVINLIKMNFILDQITKFSSEAVCPRCFHALVLH